MWIKAAIKVHFYRTFLGQILRPIFRSPIVLCCPLLLGCLAGGKSELALDRGLNKATLVITPATHDFGAIVVGNTTANQVFTITNLGRRTAINCNAPSLSGTNPLAFSIVADTCSTQDLAVGASCTVTVSSTPTLPAGTKNATLSRLCSGGVVGLTTLDGLQVTATTTPNLSVLPLTHNFGAVNIGSTSATQNFVFANTGSSAATGCSAPYLGGLNAAEFAIASDACGTNDLAVTSTCTVQVEASPTTAGVRRATLYRFCTTGGTVATTINAITATGVPVPILSMDLTTYDFKRVPVGGQSSHYTVTITNSGTADATGCAAAALTNAVDFTIVSDGCGVANLASGGGQCSVVLRANPQSAGTRTTTLSRTCGVGGTVSSTTDGVMTTGVESIITYNESHVDGVAGVDGLSGAREFILSPDGLTVYALGETDNGVAQFSRNLLTGKLTYSSLYSDNAGGANNMAAPQALAMSPDGLNLYVGSSTENALTVFDRDSATGNLTFREDHVDGAAGVDGLNGVTGVTISADGKFVYVTGNNDNAVSVFSRNQLTGALTYSTSHIDGAAGVDGVGGARGVFLSADGLNLYAVGASDNALAVFGRDAVTGALTYSTSHVDGVAGVDGVGGARAVLVSPDGSYVYGVGETDNGLGVFTRDVTNGALTYSSAFLDGVGGVDGLSGASGIGILGTGDSLFVTGATDNALALFAQNPTSGAMSFLEMIQDGVGGFDGLASAQYVQASRDGRFLYATGNTDNSLSVYNLHLKKEEALGWNEVQVDGVGGVSGIQGANSVVSSADGSHVYVVGTTSNAVSAFTRNTTTGNLTYVASYTDGAGGIDGLGGAQEVALSPDGTSLYVASNTDHAVATFSRNSTTGVLSFVEFDQDGVGGVDGLNGARSIVVSPDGEHVYVVSTGDDALAVFDRDTTTGALSFIEFHQEGVAGVSGISDPTQVIISADGAHVYVSGTTSHAVAIFDRNTTSGALTYSTKVENGVAGVLNMLSPMGLALTTDGSYLYAAANASDAVVVFSRDTSTGLLTYVESYVDNTGLISGLDGATTLGLSGNNTYLLVGSDTDNSLVQFVIDGATGKLSFNEALVEGVRGVSGLNSITQLTFSPNGHHVYVSADTGNSVAVFTHHFIRDGVLSYLETQTDGSAGVNGLAGSTKTVVSPDGRHVYATGFDDDSVAVFSRSSTDGTLTYVETQTDGSGGVNGLDGALSLAISPDGRHLYVAGKEEDSLAVFSRHLNTGALTYVETHTDNLVLVDGLADVRDVVVSPDGNHVYATGYFDDAVAIFSRNQTTGALTYSNLAQDAVGGVTGLDGPGGLVISQDGRFLYVTSIIDQSVVVFSRNLNTGALTYVETQTQGVGGVDGLGQAYHLALSPYGEHLYVTGSSSDSVALFDRNPATGTLTFVTHVTQGDGNLTGMTNPREIQVSPDGSQVMVVGYDDNSLVTFKRDLSDGKLYFLEAKTQGSGGVSGISGASSVALSPDGRHVYVSGEASDALSVFARP